MAFYQTKKIVTLMLLHTFLLSIALSCIFPFFWMVNASFKSNTEFNSDYGLKPASSLLLDNYKEVIIPWNEDFLLGKIEILLNNCFKISGNNRSWHIVV